MKRNRFEEMVPETPGDFHMSVLDALNRMETVRKRRQTRQRVRACAAAAVVVVALTALLSLSLFNRPMPEDAVVSPQESVVEKQKPVEKQEFTFAVDGFAVEEGGVRLDWTIGSNGEETVLYEYDVHFVCGGEVVTGADYSDTPDWPKKMGILGSVVQGHPLTANASQSTHYRWDDPMESDEVVALVQISFYRPIAEFFEEPFAWFENDPHWMLQPVENGLEAWPINWAGNNEYQTPYGETSMTAMEDYKRYLEDIQLEDEAQCTAQMREYRELRSTLLEIYGYAEHLTSYEVRINFGDGSVRVTEVE